MATTAYATRAQLTALAIPAAAVAGIATADQDLALLGASATANGYLRAAGYAVPLPTWHEDLTLAVCQIAAWRLMCGRGIGPEDSEALKESHDTGLQYLKDVAARKALPIDQTEDATPAVDEMAPLVSSDDIDDRGW